MLYLMILILFLIFLFILIAVAKEKELVKQQYLETQRIEEQRRIEKELEKQALEKAKRQQQYKLRNNKFESGETIFKEVDIKIAGYSFYQDNLNIVFEELKKQFPDYQEDLSYYRKDDFYDGQIIYEWNIPVNDNVQLVREPNNEHDPNAVAVLINRLKVGYLKKRLAKKLNPYINYQENQIIAHAIVLGGKYKALSNDGMRMTRGTKESIEPRLHLEIIRK